MYDAGPMAGGRLGPRPAATSKPAGGTSALNGSVIVGPTGAGKPTLVNLLERLSRAPALGLVALIDVAHPVGEVVSRTRSWPDVSIGRPKVLRRGGRPYGSVRPGNTVVEEVGMPDAGAAGLAQLRAGRATVEQAWQLYDSLPEVAVAEITTGRWAGDELDTGHPWAGVLVESGWYGKQFDSADEVQPLLFAGADGEVFPVDPRRVPLGVAGALPTAGFRAARRMLPVLRPLLRTRTARARLREIEFRGKTSAAMVYDHLPIIDLFRRVDDDTLLGVMDMRGMSAPYFFVLRRDRA